MTVDLETRARIKNEEFLEAVRLHTEDMYNISPGYLLEHCQDCEDNDEGFSYHHCETCGSRLGGDRFFAHCLLGAEKELCHLEICQDCLLYFANGDLPW